MWVLQLRIGLRVLASLSVLPEQVGAVHRLGLPANPLVSCFLQVLQYGCTSRYVEWIRVRQPSLPVLLNEPVPDVNSSRKLSQRCIQWLTPLVLPRYKARPNSLNLDSPSSQIYIELCFMSGLQWALLSRAKSIFYAILRHTTRYKVPASPLLRGSAKIRFFIVMMNLSWCLSQSKH